MARTIYLHIGMPKCASTTIQNVLQTYAEVFAAQGKFYGVAPNDRTKGQGNVTRLLADIRAGRRDRVDEALTFFLDRDSDVILSSEMFIGLARTTQAEELVAQSAERGFDTRIIFYVRRQDLWIESDYKQHIKGGSDWCDDIEALIARRIKTRVLDYHWLLENWTRSMARDKITVVPLQRGQGDLYALERFLAFLDMDPVLAAGLAIDRQNVSPPVGLVEPMRFVKSALLALGMRPQDTSKHLDRFLDRAPGMVRVPERQFLLSRDRRCVLLEQYAASNARLGADYLSGTKVFDHIPKEDTDPAASLMEEAAAVLAEYIVSDEGKMPLSWQRGLSRIRRWRRG